MHLIYYVQCEVVYCPLQLFGIYDSVSYQMTTHSLTNFILNLILLLNLRGFFF